MRPMKKTLRVVLTVVGGLLVAALLAAMALSLNSFRKLDRRIDIDATPVAFATDPAAAQRGKYLYESRGCIECHGARGGGRVFIDEPGSLFARGANLTEGRGSAVLGYTERDWVRAVRHGIKPDGRPLFIMPSEDYNRLTDADLADLVAYIRAFAPSDEPPAEIRLSLVARLAHGAGLLRDAAEKIDHRLPPSVPVAVGPTLEHGRYVAQSCIGCHRAGFEGGPIVGAPPHWPPAADLRGDAGALTPYVRWQQLRDLLQTGLRPDGSSVDAAMPRNAHMNDIDIEATYRYLKSIDARRHAAAHTP
jgi:mono/diheme cytochrome c family protein